MAKKEELHLLIHSLSKSEKRYFKLSFERKSNYLRLFEAIEKQESYDEKKIKKQFEGETFVKQLHVTKNYLRKLILKSLRNFHAQISKNAELKDLLRNVEILFHKELFSLCKSELQKARQLAYDYELLPGIVETESWDRKLEQALNPRHFKSFEEALSRQKQAIDKIANNNDYWTLAVNSSQRFTTRPDIPVTMEKHSLLESPDKALTLESKVLFYNTNYLYDLSIPNNPNEASALKTLVQLLENHPERTREEPGSYVSSINNLVGFLVFQKQHQEALSYIQRAKQLYDSWKITTENRSLLKQIMRTYNIELEIYRDTGAVEENLEFIHNIEGFVKNYQYKLPKEYLLSFWFQLASIHFTRHDFSQSLFWVNQLLNSRFKEHLHSELQIQTRMLNLMIHLEQQNLMVLRYYVDSTRRFMKKVKEVQVFEKILLKFFSRIGHTPLLEYKAAFSQLYDQLFPEDTTPLVSEETLGYINYKSWILSKITSG